MAPTDASSTYYPGNGLMQMFRNALSGTAVLIDAFDLDNRHPLLRAERFKMRYGTWIFLTIP